MALSNWDTLAFDKDGKSSNGRLILNDSASADIYKNWVYLRDEKAWHENMGFTNPTIMQLSNGVVNYCGAEIQIEGHEYQSAVFVFVSKFYWDEEKEEGWYEYQGGIGCSAYLSLIKYAKEHNPEWAAKIPWDLVEKAEYASEYSFFGGVKESTWGITILDPNATPSITDIELGTGDSPDTFVGVTDKTFRAYIEWLRKISDSGAKEWIDKIQEAPMRFNQGDAFFVGVEAVKTKIGEQESDTILCSALKATEEG
jgi:hypothetical protein